MPHEFASSIELKRRQTGIDAAQLNQLSMLTLLYQAAMFQDQYLVGLLHSGQPMCNDQCRATSHG
jgi:hypothetical protein